MARAAGIWRRHGTGRRVLASNTNTNLLHAGFKACDSYAGGEAAMTQVSCPLLFVLGEQDQMTRPRPQKD